LKAYLSVPQAIEILSIDKDIDERFQPNDSGSKLRIIALSMAIEALKQQNPQNVNNVTPMRCDESVENNLYSGFYPSCKAKAVSSDIFCRKCEQHLKWGR